MPAAEIEGRFEQGGWIRGAVPEGTQTATLDGEPLEFDIETGAFFIGLDRDAAPKVSLVFSGKNTGRVQDIEIAPRAWDIERVNVPLRPSRNGGSGASPNGWRSSPRARRIPARKAGGRLSPGR